MKRHRHHMSETVRNELILGLILCIATVSGFVAFAAALLV